jgi:DNA-binding transcriptional ArsR family regulator
MNTTTLSALAEPNRLQIVELLVQQPLTVGEIANRLNLRQPQASKHLRVLSDAGIVDVKAAANRRICSLRPEPFQELDGWLDRYRQLWQDRYDRLDEYLQQLQRGKDAAAQESSTRATPEE